MGVVGWRERPFRHHAWLLRGERARFEELSEIDVDELLRQGESEHLDTIRGGVGKPSDGAMTLAAMLKQECSLRIRRAQTLDHRIRDFAVGLYDALDQELNVNAYLSPTAAAAGLAPHHDLYDVFVLQLEGSKEWELHGDRDSRFESQAWLDRGDMSSGTEGRFRLTPGDVLYLPEGLRHRARNATSSRSFHLTVGVFAKTEHSVVEWVMTEVARRLTSGRLDDSAAGIASVHAIIDEVLERDDRVERFAAYRRGIEYERMLATPAEHDRLDARRYR